VSPVRRRTSQGFGDRSCYSDVMRCCCRLPGGTTGAATQMDIPKPTKPIRGTGFQDAVARRCRLPYDLLLLLEAGYQYDDGRVHPIPLCLLGREAARTGDYVSHPTSLVLDPTPVGSGPVAQTLLQIYQR